LGFGVPGEEIDPHCFTVTISGPANPVVITENFGLRGGNDGVPESVVRCSVSYLVWSGIANEAKRELNYRLEEKKLAVGRWLAGITKVERRIGLELCVLAWAVEAAPTEMIPNAIRNWVGLRPDERWWLFKRAASVTGTAEDVDIGWRKGDQDRAYREPDRRGSRRPPQEQEAGTLAAR